MTPPGIPPGTPPSTPMTSPSPMSSTGASGSIACGGSIGATSPDVGSALTGSGFFGAGAGAGGGGGGGGGGDATNAIIVGSSGTGAVTTITVPTRIAPTTTVHRNRHERRGPGTRRMGHLARNEIKHGSLHGVRCVRGTPTSVCCVSLLFWLAHLAGSRPLRSDTCRPGRSPPAPCRPSSARVPRGTRGCCRRRSARRRLVTRATRPKGDLRKSITVM